ncbi:hypothetical protein [Methanoregula sp.]|uniref:hypothetical protein n=1 Tax=Methanoregula sp. TaxID=2052170 RepID=UPI00237373A4|nr:hypothetical protein [Methanoregula sp.]MDD1686862.1 hypothetical protein [Methanoregula sp.]
MEGAVRVFAGEFSRSSLFVPSPDPGTPGWVVTPGGAWCRQVYISGALTEITESGDMIRCRMADPTGAFDVVCNGRNAQLVLSLQKIPVPSFVAVQGTAQMYQRNGNCILSIRPETVQAIDRPYRDRLFLITAEYTLRRLELVHQAVTGTCTDEQILRAARHYSPDIACIREMTGMVEGVVQGVRPQEPLAPPPGQEEMRQIVMELVQSTAGPRGIAVEELIDTLASKGMKKEDVLAAVESLIMDDECYQPQKGYVKLL